jgi:hypothetical protein
MERDGRQLGGNATVSLWTDQKLGQLDMHKFNEKCRLQIERSLTALFLSTLSIFRSRNPKAQVVPTFVSLTQSSLLILIQLISKNLNLLLQFLPQDEIFQAIIRFVTRRCL